MIAESKLISCITNVQNKDVCKRCTCVLHLNNHQTVLIGFRVLTWTKLKLSH